MSAHLNRMQISACHAPNVLAHSTTLDTGTVVTLYRSTPGETAPRMQMQVPGGEPVDCGSVEAPERFGNFGTPAAFKAWAARFFAQA